MKKSKILLIVLALVVVLSVGLLVACDEDTNTPEVCEHEYGDWALVKAPTYETIGSAVRICNKCTCAETVVVPVLGNSDVWTAVTTSATHSSPGRITYTSIYGNPVIINVDSLTTHVYDKEVVDERYLKSGADCEHAAVYYKTCECGAVGTDTFEDGKALGHNPVTDAAVPATCTSTGLTEGSHCARCGEVIVAQTEVAKTAHNVVDDRAIPATCTSTGLTAGKHCVDCGQVILKQLPVAKTAHIAGPEATCTADQVCLVCGSVLAEAHHVWSTDVKLVYSSSSYQEEDGSVSTSDAEATEYHTRYCTICGINDDSSKVAHNYCEEYLKVVKDYIGHEVYSYHKCNDCGYEVKTGDSCIGGYVEYSWTESDRKAPSYTEDGYIEYTYMDYTCKLTVDRLVAPYEGKSYGVFYLNVNDSNPNKALSATDRTGTTLLAIDANGKGSYEMAPLRGNVTLTMGTAVSEKVSRVTVRVDKDEDYEIFDGYVNHDNGMVVFTTDGLYNQVYVLTPYGFVNTRKITASSWNYDGLSAMAITYKATCDMGVDHPFNVFVNDGSVYFDVDYVGFDGTKVGANACYNTSFTVVDSADNTVIAYAYDGEAQHVADGAQGVYTTTLGSDLVKITLDGCGRFVTDNALVGVYTLVSDADYDVDMYVLTDGVATAYYRGTFDAATAAITATYPVATINFELGGKGNAIEAVTQNLNIPYTLTDAEPNDEKYTFVGWYTDSECTDSTKLNGTITVTSTDSVTVYAKWSDVKVTINIHDSVNGDQTIYAVPGDVFEDKLPEYAIGDFFGFNIFDGWYEDDEYENPFDETETATASDLTVDVYAKYNQAGDWRIETEKYTFEYDSTTGYWKSNNQGIGSSGAYIRIYSVGGPIQVSFKLWASGESGYDKAYYKIDGTNQYTSEDISGNKTIDDALVCNVVLPYDDNTNAVNIVYTKDSGLNKFDDTAYIAELTINGVTIVKTNSPDHKEGTYTADGRDNLVLDGFGSFTMGDTTGSYELAPDGADYTLIAYTATETYKVTLTGNTYAIADYKVSVSFDFGTLGATLDTVEVYYGKEYILPEAPSVDGHVFRNWSSSSDLNDVVTSLTGTENITVYAKYDVIVTLTYKYNDGVTADTTATFGANDSVETLAEVSETVAGKVFAGWYTQDGTETEEWGTEFLAGTTITANTTLYAKWIAPSPFAGMYTMLCMKDNATTPSDVWNSDAQKMVIDAFGTGTVTAWNGFTYGHKVTIEFVENSESVVTITEKTTKYYGIYDATTGVIVRAGSSTGFGSTIYMMVPYNADYVKADFTYAPWSIDSTYHKLITFENRNDNNSVVNIFIADNKTAHFGATWSASDVEGTAITDVANVKDNANVLDITCGTTTYKYARNSSGSLVVADDTQATYTNGDASVFFNGADKATFSDGSVGTYTVDAENTNVYHVLTDAANYNVTVDKDNRTYTIAENKVTVTYVNDKVTVASETTYAGIAYTLPSGDSLEVDGFKFRGWYTTSDFSGSKVTSATLTQDVTYYAKYDAAVTLTFDYNGQGTKAEVVANKYVGDNVSDIPPVGGSVKYDDKVFAGWFLKDAEGNFTTEASTSTKLTGNTTYYAKWIVPAASQGVYKGFEICNASNGSEKTSKIISTTVLTINATGSFTGARSISGTLSEDDFTVTNGAINVSRYAYLSDALGGIVIVGFSNNATSVGTDYYIGFKNHANITSVAYSADSFNSIYTTWMTVSYTENGDAKTMNLFIYQDVITANVTWRSGDSDVSAKACANTTNLVMYDASGNAFLKKSGSTMLGNDGKAGTYTGDYGEVVIDGYSTLTIGETSVAYTLDGDNVTYVMGNATRVIALGESTYTKVQDGYQGTYTLPDGTTQITLDGYGKAGTKTYVLNGASITVYDGDEHTRYGIDVDNKKFLGKSVFAGLTFTGTYYDEFDSSKNSISFEFDDTSVLSGVLVVRGVYKIKFTATFDGTTLTMTMTENVAYAGDWVGKTLVATLSGKTFTITSWYKTSGVYTFANQGTLTCEKYAG